MNQVKVNTDHAGFYLGHILLFSAGGKQGPEALSLAPAWEGDGLNTEISKAATSIYPTKDGRDFYLHGSLDAHPLWKTSSVSIGKIRLAKLELAHGSSSEIGSPNTRLKNWKTS